MESNFAKRDTGRCHEYQNIEIVKIDGKKYVKRKRDGKIMHANKEGVSRANTNLEENVTVILNPSHIVMIKDYGDGAVISTTLNSRTGTVYVKESKEEVLRMIQEETFYDDEF